MSGRANGGPDRDRRGSTTDRRVRRMWLMAMFGGQCVHCQRTLQDVNPDRDDYVVADRIIPGGSYRRSNIQASCAPCNAARGDDMSWTYEDGHAISR